MTAIQDLAAAAACLRSTYRVVVFTGAGISAESGIATFRDANGLWERFPPQQFASWGGLIRTAVYRPAVMAEFLHAVPEPIVEARPNPAHRALAALENQLPTTIITQNVDALHQEAGNSRVREIHGSFFEVLCGGRVKRLSRADLRTVMDRLSCCRAGWFRLPRLLSALSPLAGLGWRGLRRPRVVLFGERLAEPAWTQAQEDVRGCPVLIVVGTAGLVLPAATLPYVAKEQGAKIIQIDPADPGLGNFWLAGPAAEVMPRLVQAAFPQARLDAT
jgi:NAD-dependent deacetylase